MTMTVTISIADPSLLIRFDAICNDRNEKRSEAILRLMQQYVRSVESGTAHVAPATAETPAPVKRKKATPPEEAAKLFVLEMLRRGPVTRASLHEDERPELAPAIASLLADDKITVDGDRISIKKKDPVISK